VAGAAIIEYDGMMAELVARGIKAGSNGATSTAVASSAAAAAGAGADFFFLVARFLDFLEAAAAAPRQAHKRPMRRIHATMCMKNPEEPDLVEPELATAESLEAKESSEAELSQEAEDSPIDPEEESHPCSVVVVATAGTVTAAALA